MCGPSCMRMVAIHIAAGSFSQWDLAESGRHEKIYLNCRVSRLHWTCLFNLYMSQCGFRYVTHMSMKTSQFYASFAIVSIFPHLWFQIYLLKLFLFSLWMHSEIKGVISPVYIMMLIYHVIWPHGGPNLTPNNLTTNKCTVPAVLLCWKYMCHYFSLLFPLFLPCLDSCVDTLHQNKSGVDAMSRQPKKYVDVSKPLFSSCLSKMLRNANNPLAMPNSQHILCFVFFKSMFSQTFSFPI